MLIRDVVPPQVYEVEKKQNFADKISSKVKRGRFSFFKIFILFIFFLGTVQFSTLVVFGEADVAEFVNEKVQEIIETGDELISSKTDSVLTDEDVQASLEDVQQAVSSGDVVGSITELQDVVENGMSAINENSEDKKNNKKDKNEKAQTPPSETIEKLKIKKINSEKGAGVDRFALASLGGDIIEVVDENSGKNPYLQANLWGGEAMLKIDIPHAKSGSKKLKGDNLNISNNNFEVDIYPKNPETITENIAGQDFTFIINEDGGVEFDVVLDSIPSNNVFEFPVENRGLNFYYQPPLNEEHPTWADDDGDGEADNFRPEMVVGSYAVYYKDQEGVAKPQIDAEKYKTGKAFHIYRPKVTDGGGNWIWGELNFDEMRSVLSVTVDRAWLDSASYPVRIDPNVGYTSAGASNVTIENYIAGSLFTMDAEDYPVESITAYINPSSTSRTYANGIYLHSDLSLVTNSNTGTIAPAASGAAWRTFAYSTQPSLTASTDYVFCVWASSGTGTNVVHYDTGTTDQGHTLSATYSTTWPSPMGSPTHSTRKYSIYISYSNSQHGPPGVAAGSGMMMF